MKYVISVFYEDAEVTVKTNDPEIAILELLRADKTGNHAHVCDDSTGEVLALVNHPDQFATDEFSLMILGVLMKHSWEQDEEPIPEPEPEVEREIILNIFEVMSALCEQQKTELLPPEEPDPDPVEECASAEDMVLKMIQAMGGLPS